jgi:hypothetical protein
MNTEKACYERVYETNPKALEFADSVQLRTSTEKLTIIFNRTFQCALKTLAQKVSLIDAETTEKRSLENLSKTIGLYFHKHNEIWVDASYSIQKRSEIFCHEMFHALSDMGGFSLKESQVRTLELFFTKSVLHSWKNTLRNKLFRQIRMKFMLKWFNACFDVPLTKKEINQLIRELIVVFNNNQREFESLLERELITLK